MECKTFKRHLITQACLFASVLTYTIPVEVSANELNTTPKPVEILLAGGLTFGGDELGRAQFTNNTSDSIKAGELLDLKIGTIINLNNSPVSIQSTIGYQFDTITATNGDITFSRVPFELLGFYNAQRHRIGGGISYHISPELEIDAPNMSETLGFDNAAGVVVEYGYRLSQHAILGARYVVIDYDITENNVSTTVNGNHLGLYGYVTF